MEKALFDDLMQSLQEAEAWARGEAMPVRTMRYVGKVLVEVTENGETTWSLEQGAQESAKLIPADGSAPDVGALCATLNQTQEGFAELLGIPVGTVQGWIQGRRTPRGAALQLLRVAAQYPTILLRVSVKAA